VVCFTGQERPGFELANVTFRGRQLAVELFQQIVALVSVGLFPSETDVCLDVTGNRGEFFVRSNLLFGAFAVAQNGLRGFLVVPEIRLGNFRFE